MINGKGGQTMDDIFKALSKMEDIVPDKYDGSYELVREVVRALSTIDGEKLGIEDLNLLYFATMGTWGSGFQNKKNHVDRSNLDSMEKERLKSLIDKLYENAKEGLYKNSNKGDPSIGMFGTSVRTLKVNQEGINRFIALCTEILNMDNEEEILNKTEEALNKDIKGLVIDSISQILHCLKPTIFPILNNRAISDINTFKELNIDIEYPNDITRYIENTLKIKEFRNKNCRFKNYKVLDMFFWKQQEEKYKHMKTNGEPPYNTPIEIDKGQWMEMLEDRKIFRKEDIEIMLKIYDMGGEATATQLGEAFNRHSSAFNFQVVNLAKRIQKYTNCKLLYRESGEIRWWHTIFNGAYTASNHFLWIIRPELKEAIKGKYDELKLMVGDDKPMRNAWWMTANPSIWSWENIEVGQAIDYTSRNENGNKRRIYRNFEDAKKGDIVIGYQSTPDKAIVALGHISGEHDGERISIQKDENLIQSIEYSDLNEIEELKDMEFFKNPQGSLFKVRPEELEIIMEIIREANPSNVIKDNPAYTKEDFLREVFIEENEYDDIINLLNYKKNIILQGPPGVGKTFVAKRIAHSIMGEKDDSRIEMVQFHQSYSYEDFVMGYRPEEEGFKLRYGVFYQFCKRASNDLDNPYYFIIDEINRGNISKIFGELMMLMEADKRGEDYQVSLTYKDGKFHIPKNVHIIGTMNTADRSLAIIDYALRRRFCFIDMEPAFNNLSFRQYLMNKNSNLATSIIEKINRLNSDIENDLSLGRGFSIGHSYFCMDEDSISLRDYERIIKYEILPLLSEYWFDDLDKIKQWQAELLEG